MTATNPLIEPVVKRVQAILLEAGATPRTGRMLPGVGVLPPEASIASLIDHTLLKADASARQIEKLCFEAREYGFASVCVNSAYVPLAASLLADTPVIVCTVAGFPLGATLPQVKVYEAQEAIAAGAREVDMVLHVGALKARDLVAVFEEITEVAEMCHDHDALCKVILETSMLDDEEIVMGCQLARMAGADFVKTSTGFGGGGATVEHITLMRQVVGEGVGVKASGGVRDLTTARTLITAGANRLGASAGVSIALEELGERNRQANDGETPGDY